MTTTEKQDVAYFAPRVAAGIAVLDEMAHSGWRTLIDRDALSMWNAEACVLAQVYATDYRTAIGSLRGFADAASDDENGWAEAHGFSILDDVEDDDPEPWRDPRWSALTTAWLQALAQSG